MIKGIITLAQPNLKAPIWHNKSLRWRLIQPGCYNFICPFIKHALQTAKIKLSIHFFLMEPFLCNIGKDNLSYPDFSHGWCWIIQSSFGELKSAKSFALCLFFEPKSSLLWWNCHLLQDKAIKCQRSNKNVRRKLI